MRDPGYCSTLIPLGAARALHSQAETTYNRANKRSSPTSANGRFVHRETQMPREIAPTVIVDDLGRLLGAPKTGFEPARAGRDRNPGIKRPEISADTPCSTLSQK